MPKSVIALEAEVRVKRKSLRGMKENIDVENQL
jgi:hypothetical protein